MIALLTSSSSGSAVERPLGALRICTGSSSAGNGRPATVAIV